MITSGILAILGLAVMGFLFSFISARSGPASGYVAVSWVPPAALLAALAFHHRFGLPALGIIAAIMIVSVVSVGMGAVFTIRARRERSRRVSRLVLATMLAGAPLVWVMVAWIQSNVP